MGQVETKAEKVRRVKREIAQGNYSSVDVKLDRAADALVDVLCIRDAEEPRLPDDFVDADESRHDDGYEFDEYWPR
jgi:hypothetical protein